MHQLDGKFLVNKRGFEPLKQPSGQFLLGNLTIDCVGIGILTVWGKGKNIDLEFHSTQSFGADKILELSLNQTLVDCIRIVKEDGMPTRRVLRFRPGRD